MKPQILKLNLWFGNFNSFDLNMTGKTNSPLIKRHKPDHKTN